MSKSVAKKESNELVTPGGYEWGAVEAIEQSDLLLPKIFHMQAISKFVKEDKARAGDFCDSLTGEVLASKKDGLDIIIFSQFKTMIIEKKDFAKNKFFLDSIVTLTPENAHLYAGKKLFEEIDGEEYKNNLTYNFCCLLPNKIDELPYIISLGGTKTKAARKINTMLMRLGQLKRPGAGIVFHLASVEEKNDQGSWFGLEVSQGRDSTPQEMSKAYDWYMKSKTQKFTTTEEMHELESDDTDLPY